MVCFFSDQTFLLAQISNFKIENYENQRLNLIKNFDEFSSEKQKEEILKDFFKLIYVFDSIDGWYSKALKNNLSVKSSSIEYELEQAIQNKLNGYFEQFYSYSINFMETNGLNLSFEHFNSIWNYKLLKKINIFQI